MSDSSAPVVAQNAVPQDDILTAIKRDDFDRVKTILRESPDIADSFQNESPLRVAASLGRLDICRYLIDQHHVEVDDFDRGLGYPIIKGALAFPDVVRLLIEHHADLKTRITWRGGTTGFQIIDDEATLLHYAASSDGVPATVTLLIDNGVDIFASSRDIRGKDSGQTALHVAAIFGTADNAIAILAHPKFDQADDPPRKRILDECLVLGATPSWLTREEDRPKLISALLQKGADPNARVNGATALQMASRHFQPENDDAIRETKKMIAVLRQYGAEFDLFSAAANGEDVQVAQLLKEHPESANSRGPDGFPALHIAVNMNCENVVGQLLGAGCDIEIRSTAGRKGKPDRTALHHAAIWGRYEIAKRLIAAGADVNALSDEKQTPLHDATTMKRVELTRLLLENGANPNSRDRNKRTPLDWSRKINKGSVAAEIENVFREFRGSQGK